MTNTSFHPLVALLIVAVALMGCQDNVISPTPDMASDAATGQALETANNDCIEVRTDFTAKVVNEDVVGETIDVGECDVGAFFDEEGEVRNATFTQPDDNPGLRVQHAVYVEGAEVQVTDSEVDVSEDYERQFIAIGYHDGATGIVEQNTVTGFHRVGILLDGEDTSAKVRHNHVTGVGPKATGSAENGIQVSGGATGTLTNNTIRDHWWDENDFVSSGIIVFGSNVTVQRNILRNNDLGIALTGQGNDAVRNTIQVRKQATEVLHIGVWVTGEDNSVGPSTIIGPDLESSFAGIIVEGSNNQLSRNSINGWVESVFDAGDDTEETKKPLPFIPDHAE